MTTFYEVITAAVADMAEHGYDSIDRVEYWARLIRAAALRDLVPEVKLQRMLERTFTTVYQNMVDRGRILQTHSGLSRFTLQQVKPKLRAELDRRIMASANLIRLNREQSIEKTLQRFRGWSTSIPVGGSNVVDKVEIKTNMRKPLRQLPFEERRVLIDQGHKFTASLSNILATDGGAIAAEWHSRWREKNYDYREPHKEVDRRLFLIRDSWAHQRGLVKPDENGYTDQREMVGELPFCRCTYAYKYALRDLPATMITQKGKDELNRVRATVAAIREEARA